MAASTRHPFVALSVPAAQRDAVTAELWERGATGLEERDATTLQPAATPGLITVIASFTDETRAIEALTWARARFAAELGHTTHRDWATEWRRGFRGQRIGRRLVLRPSWEQTQADPSDAVVIIDPENAFGSGDHETTRLMLKLLEAEISGGERVLDVGCGSGVLAIAALRLGAASALALDVDDDAVAVATRNARKNGVSARIEISNHRLSEVPGTYDVVAANIETSPLIAMASELCERLAPQGRLMLSGVLREEQVELLSAFPRLRLLRALDENAWSAYLLSFGP